MNFKNIIIVVLTIAVIVLSVLLYKTFDSASLPETSKSLADQTSQFSPELKLALCMELFPETGDGDTISLNDAKLAAAAFDSLFNKDSIQAFHFGLSTLKDILESVETYNSTSGRSDSIIGLRFHRAITSRKFGSKTVRNTQDLIIVPTLKSGIDLFIVRPDTTLSEFFKSTVPIYTYSRPCPKLCSN